MTTPPRAAAGLLGLLLCAWCPSARGDAVDDAFSEGNAAARAGHWAAAAAAYERAGGLLGKPNSLLSYNLGTAYAHAGDLGRATLHLRQALDFQGNPTTELAESARANLGTVRRRAELAAATTGALIDRPQTWWDLVVETLRAPGVGWLALACGIAAAVVRILELARRARGRTWRWAGVAIWLLIGAWAAIGSLHALSLRADRTAPPAVAIAAVTDARDGPGAHRNSTWALAAGAQVRIVDRTPGWVLVRLAGAIEGWVPEAAVSELDRPFGQTR
jgi:tetratricopeptide (TPR) repeat protein